jgi:predicted amidophosphoribosyltransferase
LEIGSRLLDLVLPERCVACRAEGGLLCGPCREGLVGLGGTLCARCGAPTAWPVERCAECAGRRLPFASARSAVAYDAIARRLVVAWKERGLRRAAELAARLVLELVPKPPAQALTWIPGDVDRTLWRGVNPAEGLARELGEHWELPAAPLLVRARRIPRQRGLSRSVRRANVRHAFVPAVTPPPGVVAVIDDVYTTGATVAEAAAALKRAGGRDVHVVTFARAVRR